MKRKEIFILSSNWYR